MTEAISSGVSAITDAINSGVAALGINGNNNTTSTSDLPAVVSEGRRVYIGNLAYAASEADLSEFFKGYLVESVTVPVNPRTHKPVGYAFVDLSSTQEAQRAISELSGKDIHERRVSVQLARHPNEKPAPTTAADEEGADGENGGRRRGNNRNRGRGGRRGGRARGETGEPLPLTDVTNESHNTQAPVPGAAVSGESAEKPKQARAPRPPRQRGPPENGVPSTTKVMVANLPYDFSDEKIEELFKPYGVVSAKIALRPIPKYLVRKLEARNEPRKTRGFGFVTLDSEKNQQKAIAEVNGKQIDGREITVKVAVDSPDRLENGEEAAATPEPATATA